MRAQTAKIATRCGECGAMAVRQVNQFILDDALWSDSEFSCAACSTYICEHSGPGTVPDDVREVLLAANGPARRRLAGPLPSLLPALKVFREVSAVSLSRAQELVGELSGDGLEGTLPEMEFLMARLRARGVPVEIEQREGFR